MQDGQFLYQKVYDDLKNQIKEKRLLPNTRLPKEKELCKQYQVSMITVKRAMELLANEKLINRIPGKGTFVTEEAFQTVQETAQEMAQEEARETKASWRKKEGDSSGSGLIGVILEYAMPSFGLDLIYELDRAALAAGYRICFRFSYADRERESEEIEFLISQGVEGLVILPCHGSYYNTALLKLVIEGFPVVVLDKKLEGIQVPSIRTDNQDAVNRLIDYLREQGKSRIGIITVDEKGTVTLAERKKAFRKKIAQLHLPVMEECILPDNAYRVIKNRPIEEYVMQIMDYLRRCGKQLDGVVCTEYGNLLAFLEAVQRMKGDSHMRQILACTMDQVYLVPGGIKYAHVKQNEVAMAKKAMEILKIQIEGEKEIPEDIKIPGIFRKP